MPLSLQNKKIIISAGASGIGWAIAKICLSKGASIYLCDIDSKNIGKIKSLVARLLSWTSFLDHLYFLVLLSLKFGYFPVIIILNKI